VDGGLLMRERWSLNLPFWSVPEGGRRLVIRAGKCIGGGVVVADLSGRSGKLSRSASISAGG